METDGYGYRDTDRYGLGIVLRLNVSFKSPNLVAVLLESMPARDAEFA